MPPKDETSSRLLSKVAKFVRNPLKDWSELDAQDSVPAENGYSREMLKEMIERRQRNDFVRRREFDMLRKLRRREAAGGAEGAAAVSSFNLSTSGKSEGRALTLKKIDEIEEQMSQQWWKGRQPEAGTPPGDTGNAPPDAERQARAYADTVPGVPPPVPAPAAATDGAPIEPRPVTSALDDAAIRFAEGDDAGAETALLQSVAPDGAQADNNENWRALLDLYRATGDAEKFGAASTRYAQRLKRPGPEWVSFRALARDAQSAQAAAGPVPAASGAAWASPVRLTREHLAGLTQALAAAGAEWQLDWRALQAIAPEAVPPLRALFTHWADSPVQLRFAGAEQLLAVLAQATPMGDRQVDVAWWQLRMAVLRAVHEPDMFELAALNYCITYEVTPPPWSDPRGSYAAVEPATPAAAALAMQGDAPAALPQGAALAGELTGHCSDVLARLDRELASANPLRVSCSALVRVDLEAARALLDWTARYQDRGARIEFVEVQRLVAAFFHVVGLTDHADVAIRSR